ncbi:maleate cis-trans isomerase family protein [Pseudonocardia sp. TRM90224]|uniref:maleate cis-trans isomerase family protein n=1 Tax=Pseudonocardia sp. TRM90224 TaxID=2812678 RepID=UPI001E2A84F0|nr:maleate cis-trans isomerase [Pseudonocardia sp. TRM90224]
MWHVDGWDVTWRLGVLTPHADVGPESELRAMAPADVGIHAARVPFGAMGPGGVMDPTIPLAPVRAFVEPPGIDDAVALLGAAPLSAIGFGFTSSAYVVGARGEAAMVERLSARTDGIPVVTTCAAAATALRAFGVERVAAVHPPWFDVALNELGHDYYRAAGFDVVLAASCPLPSDQRSIRPGDLHSWAVRTVPDTADAVVIGGNGFRAVGVIDALEAQLGRPVLTANQVLLWAMLSAAGAGPGTVTGYGRLFDLR